MDSLAQPQPAESLEWAAVWIEQAKALALTLSCREVLLPRPLSPEILGCDLLLGFFKSSLCDSNVHPGLRTQLYIIFLLHHS